MSGAMPHWLGRPAALLAALLGAAAAVVAGIGLLISSRGTVIHQNVFVGPGGPIEASRSPSGVGNPKNGDNVVAVSRVDRLGFSASLEWSMNGGRSWKRTPLPLRRARTDPTRRMPRFALDGTPTGRIDAVFSTVGAIRAMSRPMSSSPRRTTTDGRFKNVRASSRSFDSRVGPSAASYLEPDLGPRLGLVSSDDAALSLWTDTRLGNRASGRQDIASARVELGRSASTSLFLAAGLLVIAGATFLGVSRIQARARRAGA